MSLFSGPDEHAANPPETWQAVKRGSGRDWVLVTKAGTTLDYFTTKRDALAARDDGWLRRLYDKEGRWYAGERIPQWRDYAGVGNDRA